MRDEVWAQVFNVEQGVLYTLGHLLRRPGHFLRDYLAGSRVRHGKPLMLLLITVAMYVLITTLLGEAWLDFNITADLDLVGEEIDSGGINPQRLLELLQQGKA